MEETVKRRVRPIWYGLFSAALALTVLLSGCGGGDGATKAPGADTSAETEVVDAQEPETVEIGVRPTLGLTSDMEYHYDENWGEVVNRMVTELPGADAETRLEYPALSDALDRFRETAHANALQAYQEREAAFPDVMDGGDMVQPLFGEVHSMVRRADAQAVSIVSLWSDYSGGAHASYGYGAANFDTVSGAEITLDDLLTDEGKLTINSRLGEELDALYTELSPGNMVADYLTDDYTFSLEPDGVTFWFNPYEIASYADGTLTVKLYFDRDADILKPDYKGLNDAWFVEIGTDVPYRFASGDAFRSVEAWRVTGEDESDWYSGVGIEFDAPEGSARWEDRVTWANAETDWNFPEGRNILLDQTGFYDGDFYYAHTPDGDYAVTVLSMENDATETTLYSADSGLLDTLYLTGPGSFSYPELPEDTDSIDDWSLYDTYHVALTDPDNVELSTRFYLFGTWGGSGTYSLTPAGFRLQGKLLYGGNTPLTLKQDLTVTRVDAEDWTLSTGETFTLPAETVVQIAATDGENTTYFRVPDIPKELFSQDVEFVFALSYDTGDWPRTIDGVEENELFDGMLYAG